MNNYHSFLLAGALFLSGCVSIVLPEDRPRRSRGRHHTAVPAAVHIPPGHLPPPGQCRIWIPGRPPGHQPPPRSCGYLHHRVPRGGWLISRPGREANHLKVAFYHEERRGTRIAVSYYRVSDGKRIRRGERRGRGRGRGNP